MANVQALVILGQIGEVNGHVRVTLDKLESIRGDLVRRDDDCKPENSLSLSTHCESRQNETHNVMKTELREEQKMGGPEASTLETERRNQNHAYIAVAPKASR